MYTRQTMNSKVKKFPNLINIEAKKRSAGSRQETWARLLTDRKEKEIILD